MLDVIRKQTHNAMLLISKGFRRVAYKIYKSPQEIRAEPWFRDNGDKTLRLDYALDENSIVFDIGGYEGQWTSDISSRYCCIIHVFEPVKQFYQNIVKRFEKNDKIIVHNIGLAAEDAIAKIKVASNCSSIFGIGDNEQSVVLKMAINFMLENNVKHIDLMKVNIEGAEYDLLDHLIETNYISRINNIQIQFHDFVKDAEKRMIKIEEKLAKTHKLTYRYPFVWENWKAIDWDRQNFTQG